MKLEQVVEFLVNQAPGVILQNFRKDCCIASTKIAMGVLDRCGFHTRAQPTLFMVYTRKLWDRMTEFDGQFREGEWSVGIGHPGLKSYTRGYNSHLVCLVRDDTDNPEFLVDLSVGQAARPEKGIPLPQAWYGPVNDWPMAMICDVAVAQYVPKMDPGFVTSPDWTIEERTLPIVDHLCKQLGPA